MITHLELATQLLDNAEDYRHSMKLLINHGETCSPNATGLLASHSLELALKSFLLIHGSDENELSQLGHNLERTWAAARNAGLNVAAISPEWLRILSAGHVFPFRYTPPARFKPAQSLDSNELYSNVKKVIRLIKEDRQRSQIQAETNPQFFTERTFIDEN